MAREFEVVEVDVGRFDRNLDVAKTYGDPIRKGIPAALVLSSDERVLYATKAGELSNARRMSATGVYDFFDGVVRSAR
jgi:thioredoxin 1